MRGLCSCVPRAHVCPALMCVTRPVRLKLGAVNHSRWWWWWQESRGGVGGYADTAGCQQATGKWMPEKAITMINLLLRFSEWVPFLPPSSPAPPLCLSLSLSCSHILIDTHAAHTHAPPPPPWPQPPCTLSLCGLFSSTSALRDGD